MSRRSSTTTAHLEPAEPIVKGTFATAKQSFGDLFKWKQRVEVTNEYGESIYVWQAPAPLKNPISLFAQLSAKDWLFFLVGFSAWFADAFDFHALSIQTTKLAKYYDRSKTDITTAITLTLLLRSVGTFMAFSEFQLTNTSAVTLAYSRIALTLILWHLGPPPFAGDDRY